MKKRGKGMSAATSPTSSKTANKHPVIIRRGSTVSKPASPATASHCHIKRSSADLSVVMRLKTSVRVRPPAAISGKNCHVPTMRTRTSADNLGKGAGALRLTLCLPGEEKLASPESAGEIQRMVQEGKERQERIQQQLQMLRHQAILLACKSNSEEPTRAEELLRAADNPMSKCERQIDSFKDAINSILEVTKQTREEVQLTKHIAAGIHSGDSPTNRVSRFVDDEDCGLFDQSSASPSNSKIRGSPSDSPLICSAIMETPEPDATQFRYYSPTISSPPVDSDCGSTRRKSWRARASGSNGTGRTCG